MIDSEIDRYRQINNQKITTEAGNTAKNSILKPSPIVIWTCKELISVPSVFYGLLANLWIGLANLARTGKAYGVTSKIDLWSI